MADARKRARQVLGGETHLGDVDDWRRVLVSSRDTLLLVWLTWVALHAFGDPPFVGPMLVALAAALALLVGISTARSTHAQVLYYATELERERTEIRIHFEDECDEVRALYAAKGFEEPLLGRIVDTLTADDDRLLKVMMEEELGLSMHHMNHPLVVGLWNFAGALIAGMALTVPAILAPADSTIYWIMGVGFLLLAIIAWVSSWATGRSVIEFLTVGMVMATVTGVAVYLMAQWLSDWMIEQPIA